MSSRCTSTFLARASRRAQVPGAWGVGDGPQEGIPDNHARVPPIAPSDSAGGPSGSLVRSRQGTGVAFVDPSTGSLAVSVTGPFGAVKLTEKFPGCEWISAR
jgi:hypothetical protein